MKRGDLLQQLLWLRNTAAREGAPLGVLPGDREGLREWCATAVALAAGDVWGKRVAWEAGRALYDAGQREAGRAAMAANALSPSVHVTLLDVAELLDVDASALRAELAQ